MLDTPEPDITNRHGPLLTSNTEKSMDNLEIPIESIDYRLNI